MNSTDALISWARKDMLKKATSLGKKKEVLQDFKATTLKVQELLETKPEGEWRTWTVPELKLVIGWKQGHVPKDPFNDAYKNMLKPQLKTLCEGKYQAAPDPIDSMWTEDNEEELAKLLAGEIEDVSVECGLVQALDRDDEEIMIRLKNKASNRKLKILTASFRSLPSRKRREFLDELSLMVDVDGEESIGSVDSDIFNDQNDDSSDDEDLQPVVLNQRS